MAKIITVASRKGGTGKTSTCTALGYAFSEQEFDVLLIDCDSQRNLTRSLQLQKEKKHTINDVFLTDTDIKKAITETKLNRIDLVMSEQLLNDLDYNLAQSDIEDKKKILKQKLQSVEGKYDFILIDTPPSFNFATYNAIIAADKVLILGKAGVFDWYAINELYELINNLADNHNLEIDIDIMATQLDMRANLSSEFIEDLKTVYPNEYLNIYINLNIAIANAQMEELPVQLYSPQAKSSKQYNKLAQKYIDEMIFE